jgi:hypothetical protein
MSNEFEQYDIDHYQIENLEPQDERIQRQIDKISGIRTDVINLMAQSIYEDWPTEHIYEDENHRRLTIERHCEDAIISLLRIEGIVFLHNNYAFKTKLGHLAARVRTCLRENFTKEGIIWDQLGPTRDPWRHLKYDSGSFGRAFSGAIYQAKLRNASTRLIIPEYGEIQNNSLTVVDGSVKVMGGITQSYLRRYNKE